MTVEPPLPIDPTSSLPPQNGNEWTPRQVAGLILLVLIAAVLVWNVLRPEEIFVSDMEYEVLKADLFDPRNDQSVEGNPLNIYHSFYAKGIGVHADSEIFIRFVPENYTHFVAEIGIDGEVGDATSSSVIFSVYGGGAEGRLATDSALLYQGPVMRTGMNPRRIHLPVRGMRSLTLSVTATDDGNEGDHADWGMARFVVE